jgi:hypothetical protein
MTHGDGDLPIETKHELADIHGVESVGERDTPEGTVIVVRVREGAEPDLGAVPQTAAGHPVEVKWTRGVDLLMHQRRSVAHPDASTLNARETRPLVGGVSVGSAQKDSAGTLCIPFEDDEGNLYISSNRHIFGQPGASVVQPGVLDGGCTPDFTVGSVAAAGEKVIIDGTEVHIDFALAALAEGVAVEQSVNGVGDVTGWRDPRVGDMVQKSGRSTGVTDGEVTERNVTVSLDGSFIDNQVFVATHTKAGDSGSPVVSNGGEFLGIIWGSTEADAVMNPAGAVVAFARRELNAEPMGLSPPQDGDGGPSSGDEPRGMDPKVALSLAALAGFGVLRATQD